MAYSAKKQPEQKQTNLEHVAMLIRHKRVDTEQRWLNQVQADLDNQQEVSMTDLKDGISEYIQRLADSLLGVGSMHIKGAAVWSDIAKEHAITRLRLGFDITQLV